MSTYLINFIVYSMAMVGLLFVCLMVYKKTMLNNKCMKKNDELAIENALNLSQRKTLYVIKAGNEKFLIAADVERTTFLAKLDEKNIISSSTSSPVLNNSKDVFQEQVMPIISQVKNTFFETKNKAKSEEPKQVLVDVKPVDYSEVMASLKKNQSQKTMGKSPVMREMVRKLSQPIFGDEEETIQ